MHPHDLSAGGDVLDRVTRCAGQAAGHYGCHPAATITLLNVSENATYLVEDPDQGPSILRVHRLGYHTRPEIESELAWMDALRGEAGVRTPRVLPAPDGRRVIAATDPASGERRDCVRFEYLAGLVPSVGDNLILLSCSAIAVLGALNVIGIRESAALTAFMAVSSLVMNLVVVTVVTVPLDAHARRPVAEQFVGDVPVPAVTKDVMPPAKRPLASAAPGVVPDQIGQHGLGGRVVVQVSVDDKNGHHRAAEILDALPAPDHDAKNRAQDGHPCQARSDVSDVHVRVLCPVVGWRRGTRDGTNRSCGFRVKAWSKKRHGLSSPPRMYVGGPSAFRAILAFLGVRVPRRRSRERR